MEPMRYLDIVKRRRYLITISCLVVAAVSSVVSMLQAPVYSATATVLLLPNDPAERLDPSGFGSGGDPGSLDRYVTSQINVVNSEATAQRAAEVIGGISTAELLDRISVAQRGSSEIITISAADRRAGRSRDMANAVARAYIEERRSEDIANSQRAADGIQIQIDGLLARISKLEAQMNRSASSPGPTTPPTTSASAPPASAGAEPTSPEAAKAAFNAAVEQYQTLYARQQELLAEMPLKKGSSRLISEAKTPQTPENRRAKRDGVLGIFAGLGLGLGIALLEDRIRDQIRSRHDAERATGLPVLAELPFDRQSERHEAALVVCARPEAPLAEAIRSVRTSVEVQSIDRPITLLLITSPGPQEGTSLLAANLGVVYAEAGARTVVVSADLRRPGIERLFGISVDERGFGLTHALANITGQSAYQRYGEGETLEETSAQVVHDEARRVVADALVATEVAGLYILPAGPPVANPANLLGSPEMGLVLRELASCFEMVVIDSPPVLPVTDAAVLATKADAILLVTMAGVTARGDAGQAVAILKRSSTTLLGTVLNKVSWGPTHADYGSRRPPVALVPRNERATSSVREETSPQMPAATSVEDSGR